MKKALFTLAPLCLAATSMAQVVYTGGTYSQNFDSLTPAGAWANNSTLVGWFAGTDATPSITAFGLNTGATTTAGLYSFGSTSAADRALGWAPSNTFTGASGVGMGRYGFRVNNATTDVITQFTIEYSAEQWRKDNTSAHTLALEYKVNATGLTDTGFTAVNNFVTLQNATGGAIDGNLAANRGTLSATITLGTPLAAGDSLFFRWNDLNDSGNDHFIALDDVSFSAVPEPATMFALAAGSLLALRRRKRS